MADYYPLLARALDALPDRSPAMRKAVYDRARGALIGQLRSLEPPLSQEDIDLESKALDAAIERLEVDYGAPLPANDAALAAALPEPAPPPPAPEAVPFSAPPEPAEARRPEPVSDDGLFEAEPETRRQPSPPVFVEAESSRHEPSLPPAPPPDLGPTTVPAEPEPVRDAPPLAIAPRKAREPAKAAEPEEPGPALPLGEAEAAGRDAEPDAEGASARSDGGRQRPRIDVVPPRGGRSKLLRNAFVGAVLALVIGLIAVAAFLLRDKPADLQQNDAETSAPADGSDQKFSDRVGGEPAPAQPAQGASGTAQNEAPAQAAPPSQADLAVAQRATLIEENTAGQNAQPTSTTGRAVWRLDSVSGEQGQPLETAVVATLEFPEAGLTLVATLQRNLDPTLPASHTIKLAFTPSGPEGERRAVQDIGLLQAKDEEAARGSPLSGLPVRVRENLFLIGLSSLRNDVDRNTDLLLHRNWFDLAVKYASGQRAVITFEKGNSGAYALQRAFEQWR
ncbi:histidine kinase [Methylobacterium durans]|uniref:Histidine kinase n=1 Tax=Methylobacterium durans TaxID=2202825 RepID=A0A2U8W2G3_9HYPH|nr:histidine kinase [Methylobacterium durans]AWN40257.1 histidine kinase [Methylobacterium durans]